jgi:hypothetical protein
MKLRHAPNYDGKSGIGQEAPAKTPYARPH